MIRQLAARLRPELEAAVKANETAPGTSYIPGDFTQARSLPSAGIPCASLLVHVEIGRPTLVQLTHPVQSCLP